MTITTTDEVARLERTIEESTGYEAYLIQAEIASAVINHVEDRQQICDERCTGTYVDFAFVAESFKHDPEVDPADPRCYISPSDVRHIVEDLIGEGYLFIHSQDRRGGSYCLTRKWFARGRSDI